MNNDKSNDNADEVDNSHYLSVIQGEGVGAAGIARWEVHDVLEATHRIVTIT